METHTPSLGDQIARLRGTAQAQEKCAWIPAAIHALIIAVLTRIFGRLEQIFHLWQSGDLPAPQIRTPRAPHSRATSRRTGHRARTRARPASAIIMLAPRRSPPAGRPPPVARCRASQQPQAPAYARARRAPLRQTIRKNPGIDGAKP